jgi:hypothetical protein
MRDFWNTNVDWVNEKGAWVTYVGVLFLARSASASHVAGGVLVVASVRVNGDLVDGGSLVQRTTTWCAATLLSSSTSPTTTP